MQRIAREGFRGDRLFADHLRSRHHILENARQFDLGLFIGDGDEIGGTGFRSDMPRLQLPETRHDLVFRYFADDRCDLVCVYDWHA